MKSILRILCVATLAFVLGGCNPISKIHLHGVTNISSPGTASSIIGTNAQETLSKLFSQSGAAVPIILNVDAENELALNVKATEAQFTLSDGKRTYATATLTEPITLRHKTRETVAVPLEINLEGGFLQTLSFVRKVLNSPETMTIQGEVTGKCAGVKKKKVVAPRPLSDFMSNFARK
ncbi:MAG: hypothetical protein J6R87_00285 [Rikenellaceae bacterium]|nr:hypothetical protein [Rikenellaceae bacterium]